MFNIITSFPHILFHSDNKPALNKFGVYTANKFVASFPIVLARLLGCLVPYHFLFFLILFPAWYKVQHSFPINIAGVEFIDHFVYMIK